MKRHIKYNSIEQYRTIVKNVQHQAQYVGYNEDTKEVIYDRTMKNPTVVVTASEKIHGTNAAFCMSIPDGFWVQSRENIITPESDNAGCAFTAYQNEQHWQQIIFKLADEYNIDLNENIISVYYEWSGGNIQKNSALSGLDKRSVIFQHFKVSPIEPRLDKEGNEEAAYWLETMVEGDMYGNGPNVKLWIENKKANIYNIMDFPTYEISIDFERPDLAQNELVKLVEEIIEPNSPVGKHFGVDGNIGEGVVCTFVYKDILYKFKVKGEKHSNSKVKTLKPVDNEKEQAKIDFATYACPAWRLEQMYKQIQDENGDVTIKDMGTFLKKVHGDIIKEESDVMFEKGFEPKEVNGAISQIAKRWFQDELNRDVGL